jgi:hypothetical protein
MKTSPVETSTVVAEAVHPIAPVEPVDSSVTRRATLRTRSGIKAGAFNRGGGVYG